MTSCTSCYGAGTAGPLCPACAGQVRSDLALPLGATLARGRYQIGRTLGEPGGFGITYLAWDASLERRVAVKEFFPRHLVSRTAGRTEPSPSGGEAASEFSAGLRGFLDEGRRLAKLDHPSIVKVHDYCEENGTGYLVMSYYEGHDLRDHWERAGRHVEWQEAVSIVLPLLDGLREVHRAGLIHRDIKPANIYLATLADGTLRPILIDFGAARWATTTHELTAVLTEGFAPLEQYPGCGPQGSYTDLYAVAATLYTVVSGIVPASAPSRLTMSYVSHLTDLVPGVPRRVGDAIEQALSIQADDRPQSADEFARNLRTAAGAVTSRVIAGLPAQFGPSSGSAHAHHDDLATTIPATAANAAIPRGGARDRAAHPVRRPFALPAYLLAGALAVGGLAYLVGQQGARATPDVVLPAARPTAQDPARAQRAEQHRRDAALALDGGDYTSAMAAARALHALSSQEGVSADARAAWRARADSIAGVIATACPAERDLSARRGVNLPPCPPRDW